MDYSLHPQLALRAIRCTNVRFGILPSQSRLRGNDGIFFIGSTRRRWAGEASLENATQSADEVSSREVQASAKLRVVELAVVPGQVAVDPGRGDARAKR